MLLAVGRVRTRVCAASGPYILTGVGLSAARVGARSDLNIRLRSRMLAACLCTLYPPPPAMTPTPCASIAVAAAGPVAA